MRSIPLIRAARVANLADLVEGLGVPAEACMEASRISPAVRDNPKGFLAAPTAWAFAGAVAESQGLRDLCLDVPLRAPWRALGEWAGLLARSVTLFEAIHAMIVSYPREVQMVELGLWTCPETAWFWRRRTVNSEGWPGAEAAEQYMLAHMLRVVRLAAGDDWIPERVELETRASGWASESALLAGTRVEFGRPGLAIAIPNPLLQLPIRRDELGDPPLPEGTDEVGENFEASLKEILRPLICWRRPSLEDVSEMVDRSPRTIRRWLALTGTSWRQILDDVVFKLAVERLADGNIAIVEVAAELGYSSPAHFTRSFCRRAGIPPSRYRAERESLST